MSNYNIEFVNELTSTNSYLKELVKNKGIYAPYCVYAGAQTAGRGQRSKVWESQPFDNILSSFLAEDIGPIQKLSHLNNAAIISVVNTLIRFDVKHVLVKWPNDVYISDKKIAGILIENIVSNQIIKTAIVGIGVNINQQNFGPLEATSVIRELGYSISVIEFLQILYTEFYSNLNEDHAYLNQQMNSSLYKQGEIVNFEVGDDIRSFTIENIGLDGKLNVISSDSKLALEHHKVKWVK